jgi:hypothetical protein
MKNDLQLEAAASQSRGKYLHRMARGNTAVSEKLKQSLCVE